MISLFKTIISYKNSALTKVVLRYKVCKLVYQTIPDLQKHGEKVPKFIIYLLNIQVIFSSIAPARMWFCFILPVHLKIDLILPNNKKNHEYVLKWNFVFFFDRTKIAYIWWKMLMSAELKRCLTWFSYSLDFL